MSYQEIRERVTRLDGVSGSTQGHCQTLRLALEGCASNGAKSGFCMMGTLGVGVGRRWLFSSQSVRSSLYASLLNF